MRYWIEIWWLRRPLESSWHTVTFQKPVWDDVSFVTLCMILLEVSIRGWERCGHQRLDMVQQRLNAAQLVWVGWVHSYMLFTPNFEGHRWNRHSGVEPSVVFCCSSPSPSRFDVSCVRSPFFPFSCSVGTSCLDHVYVTKGIELRPRDRLIGYLR